MKNKLVVANEINQCTVERHNVAISESLSNYHLGKITKGNENIFAPVRLYYLKCHFFILKVTFLNNLVLLVAKGDKKPRKNILYQRLQILNTALTNIRRR